jgi:alkanesulfonate monooxygenase SsuD/methylene tetrahydromethanopterin reductase-like flavin-dependent oxidoreductase (luciferase family)
MNAYSEKCEEYGYTCQPDQLGWALPLYVAETDEKAIKEARPHIESFFNKFVLAPTEYRMPPGYSSINSYKMIMENKMKFREQYLSIEMLMENGMFICGSASTVSEKLEAYQADMGYGNLVIMGQFATLDHEHTKKSMQIFAEEVIPKLRHIGSSNSANRE